MGIDPCVRIDTSAAIDSFLEMAHKLDISQIAVSGAGAPQTILTKDSVTLYSRLDLTSSRLSTIKKQIEQNRKKVILIAVPLRNIEIANWAAEDPRVDFLTIADFNKESQLRKTTAKLAAISETALEIPILPLLMHHGLERARILKVYRNATNIALKEGMQIVLSSAARKPIQMRSSSALEFIGKTLGLERKYIHRAFLWIKKRVAQNEHRLSPNFIMPGVEVVKDDVHENL